LLVLWAGLLIVVVVGVLLATRHQRWHGQRGTGGSVTDWGESLALVYELRREIQRLREENLRPGITRGSEVREVNGSPSGSLTGE
jgi:hypothetical protein